MNFKLIGRQYIDLRGLMKLLKQFNLLQRYLIAFNYAGLNLNKTPQELEKCATEDKNVRNSSQSNL